jgi:DNA-binding LytR/AlgR family response regulator
MISSEKNTPRQTTKAGNSGYQVDRLAPVIKMELEKSSSVRTLFQGKSDRLSGKDIIFIKQHKEYTRLLLTDIQHITANDNYVTLFANNRNYLLRKTIREIEEILPGNFVRIQRSTIINILHLDRFTSEEVVIKEKYFSIGNSYYENLVHRLNILQG